MKLGKLTLLIQGSRHYTMITLMGLILLLLVWGFIAMLIHQEYQSAVEEVQISNNNLAKSFEEHVRRTFIGADLKLNLIKDEYEREKKVTPALSAMLLSAPADPAIIQTAIADENGDYIANMITPPPALRNIAFREYFQTLRDQENIGLLISKPVLGNSTGKWSIVLSRRINNEDGSFKGIVFSALSSDYFDQFYRKMELDNGTLIILTGLDGIILVRTENREMQTGMDISKGTLYQHVKNKPIDSIIIPSSIDGQIRFMSYRVLPDYPLFVVVGANKEQILAPYYRRRFTYILSATLVSLFIIGAGYMINLRRERELGVQKALQYSNEKYMKAFSASPDAISINRLWDGLCLDTNYGFTKLLSYDRNEAVGRTTNEINIWANSNEQKIFVESLLEKGEVSLYDAELITKQGNSRNCQISANLLEIDGKLCILSVVRDITERRQADRELANYRSYLEDEIQVRKRVQEELSKKTEELQYMAYSDILTGLPNRASLKEHLDGELDKAQRGESFGVVIFIDLDNLKMVNDAYGHKNGDAIIIMAGQRIVHTLGDEAFVARLGGDEFIVIFPGKGDKQEIGKIGDNIINALSQEYEVLGLRFYMSASAGIAVYPQDGDTSEEIMKNADNAMYEAKKAGKNRWESFEIAMQTQAYEKVLLTNSLRHAVARGELQVLYQPQVVTDCSNIVGFEALLRWNSLEFGKISPVQFIPLAEQSGMIHLIGEWVLKEACQFVSRLNEQGWEDICVAVNVSPYQLVADNFIEIVTTTIKNAGIEPHQIELEITETALMSSLDEVIQILDEFTKLGINISLDDFGTGHSSLTHLNRLPVKTLKIDKSFIDMIILEKTHSTIIETIINMAHSMGMTVVAEGVETQQQRNYLIRCHCDLLQGYIFSPPVPEEEAVQFLNSKTCRIPI